MANEQARVADVLNPATEQVIAQVRLHEADEVDKVVERALRAYPLWRGLAPGERAGLLRAFALKVAEHRTQLAGLEVANSGHTYPTALWEVDNVVNVLTYYAAAPERLFGRQIPVAGGVDVTFKEPLGVVGVIAPWNFPMPIAVWGVAPALAAGNTVVLKPALYTPLTALRLGELAIEAGLPDGVLNVLTGTGCVVGRRLVAHPDVRKVVFTGSTEVGREIMAGCAAQVKRLTLELGGKSANIVFADADVARAAASAPGAVFDNAGQDCCARSRILVQRSVFDAFLEEMERVVRSMCVQDPAIEGTDMGPLIRREHLEAVRAKMDAPIAFAGTAPSGKGFWMPPTVLMPESTSARAWREEIFGPVACVLPFDDEADAIRLANEGEYGLSGSIWTRDLGRALRVSRALESGNLSVNSNSSVRFWTPFGGFKQSGLGRELGPDALDAFTETKNVFLATD